MIPDTAPASELRVLRAEVPDERRVWIEALDQLRRIEPFAHPAYLELFVRDDQWARCALMSSDEQMIVHPFLLRTIHGFGDTPEPTGMTDTCGPPYGWSGPHVPDGAGADAIVRFYDAWRAWATGAGVVSDYQTLCPMDGIAAAFPGQIAAKLPVVHRSLQPDEESIWMDYRKKVRRHVRAARREGLTVEFDEEGRELDAFLEVYYGTMKRRNAAERYYFPSSFFEGIISGLPGRFVFAHVRDSGTIVSTTLALLSARCAFAYLGGTHVEAFGKHPNELLDHELAMWAKARGMAWYALGGGVSGEDSLFEYKRSFAPTGVVDLQVGRWVLDQPAYDRLVEARDRRGPRADSEYFPAYRAP